jgi:hypothetical protein
MKPIHEVVALAIVFSVFLSCGCTSQDPPGPASTNVTPDAFSTCGFTSCHGTDLACGTVSPQACPMNYQIGDKCRQFASCERSGGSCRLITTSRFEACKSCVEKCGGADATEIFSCEEKC